MFPEPHSRHERTGRAGDGWYYYLDDKIRFPLMATCTVSKIVSPRRKGETVEVLKLAPEEACTGDMLVLIRWQGRAMAVPLSQLAAVDPDEATAEAIADLKGEPLVRPVRLEEV